MCRTICVRPSPPLHGCLETLLMKEATLRPDKRRTYLEIALRQSEHMRKLITELFDLAKLDFKGYQIEPELVQLADLAGDVLPKFQLTAETRQVDLHTTIANSVPFVYVDICLIERVLENLIENALTHTKFAGRVGVAVTAMDGQVMVGVSNTGDAIPEQDIPHIFNRFYRVDKSRGSASAHAGLGLAIVKRIIELHGGELTVSSNPEAGTTFAFALPAVVQS